MCKQHGYPWGSYMRDHSSLLIASKGEGRERERKRASGRYPGLGASQLCDWEQFRSRNGHYQYGLEMRLRSLCFEHPESLVGKQHMLSIWIWLKARVIPCGFWDVTADWHLLGESNHGDICWNGGGGEELKSKARHQSKKRKKEWKSRGSGFLRAES